MDRARLLVVLAAAGGLVALGGAPCSPEYRVAVSNAALPVVRFRIVAVGPSALVRVGAVRVWWTGSNRLQAGDRGG